MEISKYFSLILYVIGILGIFFSVLLIGFKIHKKNKILSISTLLIIFLSLISVGIGTIFNLIDKKSNPTSANAITVDKDKKKENNKETNLNTDQLTLKYNLSDSRAFITITNITDSVFNGNINLNFFDKDNKKICTKTLPVKNLLPNSDTNYTLNVENAEKLTYTFSGDFKDKNDTDINYSIKSIGIGGNYYRFDVIPINKDEKTIKSICDEFNTIYNSEMCSGFLIYFVSENNDFDSSYIEYYCDYDNNIVKLTKY